MRVTFYQEVQQTVKLAIPVVLSQLLTAIAGFVDTVMSGRAGVDDLAGVAVGSAFWLTLMIIPMGLFMAINPIVGQYAGAKNYTAIRIFMHQSLRVGAVLSLIMWLIFTFNDFYLAGILQDANVLAVTQGYLRGFAWGAPAMILTFILRPYSEGLSFTRPYLLATVVSLVVNIPANYVLIFGFADWPGMGGAGAGWATAIAMWASFLVLFYFTLKHRHYRVVDLYHTWLDFDPAELKHLLHVGMPIAFALFVEVSIFSLIALFIGGRPSSEIAAHQVAMNVAYLAFTLPLSLSIVATIRVSNHLGAKAFDEAKQAAKVAFLLAVLAALLNIVMLVSFSQQIASVYSADPIVQQLAAGLMLYAAMFQMADAFVVPTQGALRGYKDTRWPMLFAVLAYWLIALPLGYLLGLTDSLVPMMGVAGFWVSLVIGLVISGFMMSGRLLMIFQRKTPTI